MSFVSPNFHSLARSIYVSYIAKSLGEKQRKIDRERSFYEISTYLWSRRIYRSVFCDVYAR